MRALAMQNVTCTIAAKIEITKHLRSIKKSRPPRPAFSHCQNLMTSSGDVDLLLRLCLLFLLFLYLNFENTVFIFCGNIIFPGILR